MSPEKHAGILIFPPWRESGPDGRIASAAQVVSCPCGRGARIRILYLIRHGWRDEGEGVGAYEDAWNRNFHLRHVAGHTLAPRGAIIVVRVLRQGRFARRRARAGPVAIEANFIHRLAQLRVIFVPCTSWQSKHVTPRRYITLCTKSFPCIRFLCAVRRGNA